jgi:hypothetical protein
MRWSLKKIFRTCALRARVFQPQEEGKKCRKKRSAEEGKKNKKRRFQKQQPSVLQEFSQRNQPVSFTFAARLSFNSSKVKLAWLSLKQQPCV